MIIRILNQIIFTLHLLKFYDSIPFFRLIIPFIFGIIGGIFIPIPRTYTLILFLCPVIITVTFGGIRWVYKRYKLRWIYGILLHLSLCVAGYTLVIQNNESKDDFHLGNYDAVKRWYKVKVTSPPELKSNSYRVPIEIIAFKDSVKWSKTSGRAITYFQKSDSIAHIQYGDVLLIQSKLSKISPPHNPGEFNYQRYLQFQNVFHQGFVHSDNWIHTHENKGNPIVFFSNNLRTYLLNVFTKNGLKGDEYAVASALILGYKDALESELIRSYSSAGATHVLAVSGLHVGIIYIILNSLLFFFARIKYGHIFKAFLLISFLWFYALLTGLSPSVLRASTMFSFIIIAEATKRNTNIYNTLAASAFFLLLVNPLLLMQVGFQLSYLAVLGIVYIQPKIYNWFTVSNWLLEKAWELTSVSIAAQIATFPLGLLYFHQFPNYFFLSNLFVIPLATLVVYLGILLFIVSGWSLAAMLISKALYWCIHVMNYGISLVESIPHALSDDVFISPLEMLLIYTFILLMLIHFHVNKLAPLQLALCSLFILFSIQIVWDIKQSNQKTLTVYDIPKSSALSFISGHAAQIVGDSLLTNTPNSIQYRVKPHLLKLGISDTILMPPLKKTKNHFFTFDGHSVAVIYNTAVRFNQPIQTDYLIISHQTHLKINELLTNYTFNKLIIDSSHPIWLSEKWKNEALALGVDIHAVPTDGAFVCNL